MVEPMNTNPEKYLWGIFYFDKEDPRVIVPKENRMMGFTLNFARPGSFLILIILVITAFIASHLGK